MKTNLLWQKCIGDILSKGSISAPRGKKVNELIGYSYQIEMNDSIITLMSRGMNYGFMFAEAAWIVSGSNWLDEITPYMSRYKDFSDDGIMLHGAYGPKVADQLMYVCNCIERDFDTRQAVINIWREKPGVSKDIPCTLNMQFIVRNNRLHTVVNMRSQDAILGMSYDIFTFSMIANMVRVLLSARGIVVSLGVLHMHIGSFHIYEEHFEKSQVWIKDYISVSDVTNLNDISANLACNSFTPRQLIDSLKSYAENMKGKK